MQTVSIVGPGKVGTAIGVLAARAGWPVAAVAGGAPGRAEAAAKTIGHGVRACGSADAARAGEIVLLTVPDDAIANVCEELADAGAFQQGAVVAHCSGSLAGDVLAAARERGDCAVASMHPLQTFPTASAGVARLPGTHWFLEGDAAAVERLGPFVEAVGGVPAGIDAGAKALYHAAACVACNYLAALMDTAAAMAQPAGIDRDTWLAAAGPMVRAGLENTLQMGPEAALTGPIVRGDAATVARHVEALASLPVPLQSVYAVLGGYSVELASRAGRLGTEEKLTLLLTIKRLLDGKA